MVNEKSLSLIRETEGFRDHAYLCPAGVWTCGFGETGLGIHEGTEMTLMEADKRLRIKAQTIEDQINKLVRIPLTENQLAALVSLVYNIGIGAFTHSTLLIRLNDGDPEGAANQFLVWDRINHVEYPGLLKRRQKEKELFLT